MCMPPCIYKEYVLSEFSKQVDSNDTNIRIIMEQFSKIVTESDECQLRSLPILTQILILADSEQILNMFC